MKILVIVESFTKEKTVQKYLQKTIGKEHNVVVKASGGHVCDIEKKNFGLDAKTFEPVYHVLDDKRKTLDALKKLAKASHVVYLAADNDREGEAIAWSLMNYLKPKDYRRIVFNEITEDALRAAIASPREIDMRMVRSQQARRVLDRLVGFNITQVLWKQFTGTSMLTAGRVQSVVLKLIAEREAEVARFVSERYWTLMNTFDNGVTEAKLCDARGIVKFDSSNQLLKVMTTLHNKNEYVVGDASTATAKEYPDPPFTTSTMQQRAHAKGISIKETMRLAQELYEKGHITYMRTDSTALSKDFVGRAQAHIRETHGAQYVAGETRRKGSGGKQANAQEAHEAIRPTKLTRVSTLTGKHKALYDLIFDRTIASLMPPAKYQELTVRMDHAALASSALYFRGKARILVELGYLKAYEHDGEERRKIQTDFGIKVGGKSNKAVRSQEMVGHCVWTTPPQRFNESSIIKTMEEAGIGRPSTYVSIVNKLYDRQFMEKRNVMGPEQDYTHYVVGGGNGKIRERVERKPLYDERSKLVPMRNGDAVNAFIAEHFPDIINVRFTSDMETQLDLIASGRTRYHDVIPSFHDTITRKCAGLKAAVRSADDKIAVKQDRAVYRAGGRDVIVRGAKFGPVIEIPSATKDSGAKSTFVALKPFLKLYGKGVTDVTEADVRFLLGFPITHKHFELHYKSYGFYVLDTRSGKTASVKRRAAVDQLRDKEYAEVVAGLSFK